LGHPSPKFSEVLGSISRMKRTVSSSVSSATGMELISQDGSLMSTVGVNLSEEETDLKKKKKKKKKRKRKRKRVILYRGEKLDPR
jgi:hypothetical protein